MHALARKDGGVSSTYWNLGEICGAYRTRHADLSLEKTWYLSDGLFGCASKSSKFLGGGGVPSPSSQRQISILRA